MSASADLYPSPSTVRSIVALCSVCATLAITSVLLRIYVKWRYLKLMLDDLFMAGAALFFLVFCVSLSCAMRSVERNKVVDMRHIETAVQMLNVSQYFSILCLMLLKISLGIFFLKLTFSRVHQVIIYVAVTLSLVFSIIMFLYTVFQCGYYRDITEFLLRRVSHQCASTSTALGISFTFATMVALTDWTFILLPVLIFWPTLKSLDQKVKFCLFMAFVSIAGIAVIARMPYIKRLAVPKRGFLAHIEPVAAWSVVESGIGITAASIITLRPLFSAASGAKDVGYLDLEMVRNAPPAHTEVTRASNEVVQEAADEIVAVAEPRSIYLEPQPVFKAPRLSRRGNVFMLTRPGARDPGLPLMVFDSGSESEKDAR